MVACSPECAPRIKRAGVLFVLCLLLLLVPAVNLVSAAGCHYEFDKDYYHPGDTGCLLVDVSNNQPDYVTIAQATLNITRIGVFTWDSSTINASDLHSASIVEGFIRYDPNTNSWVTGPVCRIEKGGSATLRIYFKIPEGANNSNYPYTFNMPITTDIPVGISGSIAVYPQGEAPPPDIVGNMLSYLFVAGLLSLLLFTSVYLALRWKKRARVAKYAKIALILSVLLMFVAAWKIIALAMFMSFVFFPFWPLLVFIFIAVLLWRRRRRRKKEKSKPVDS